jgi:hypothetical protein
VDRLALAYALFPLLFWLVGSVLAYGIGTNIFWLARSKGLHLSPYLPLFVEVPRFLFFLGIPYLALGGWPRRPFQGLLSFKDLGLVGLGLDWPVTRWLGAVGMGLGLGLAALLILALAWKYANRGAGNVRLGFPSRPWGMLLVDGLYQEVHWAFYRGALVVMLNDLYAGVFLGLGLVYLEWSLNPSWRQGWRLGSRAAGQWLRAALALVAALVFLLTRNLWICLGVHWLLELTFWQLGRARAKNADVQNLRVP